MRSMFRFLLHRTFFAILTLILVSIFLYGVIYFSPLELRVNLFMPPHRSPRLTDEAIARFRQMIIDDNHLEDPFYIQYWHWLSNFVENQWGYSPSLHQQVLPAILANSPDTIELTICSLLLIIPLSLASGIAAANKKDKSGDFLIRVLSMIASHIPLFVMAYLLLAIFYIGLGWANLSGVDTSLLETTEGYRSYTGMSILDGLLNGRLDVVFKALQHLSLPVLTITASQWAFLSRLTRNTTLEELQKDYVLAAKARGASPRRVIMNHILRNTMSVFLSNTAISAASIVTGVFVVERIFVLPGVSEVIFRQGGFMPDAVVVIGFSIYCVLMVLALMLILDLINASINPMIGREVTGGGDGG